MNVNEWLGMVGLDVAESHSGDVRELLAVETKKEAARQGAGDTALMRLCCVQLFNLGHANDVLLIWRAKVSSMDADSSIDVELLCGAGLENTKAYLRSLAQKEADEVLARIVECEESGDFVDFDVDNYKQQNVDYYDDPA